MADTTFLSQYICSQKTTSLSMTQGNTNKSLLHKTPNSEKYLQLQNKYPCNNWIPSFMKETFPGGLLDHKKCEETWNKIAGMALRSDDLCTRILDNH